MSAENLLVVNVLPENDPKAQEAIQSLRHIAMNIQVIHGFCKSPVPAWRFLYYFQRDGRHWTYY